MATTYEVYAGEDRVLEIADTPGALVSISAPPPPPGVEPPPHPFLSATAYVATEESRLREILNGSASTSDYVERLRAAGYTVIEKE